MKPSAYPQLLILDLARVYADAALNELLRGEAPAPTKMNTTIKDKDSKDITGRVVCREVLPAARHR